MLLRNGILEGYSAPFRNDYLIVKDLRIKDARNGSVLVCVVVLRNDTTRILGRSDPTILYIASEY